MGVFQKPASTPEQIERSRPLALPPDEVADLDEDAWYARVYRGDDVPQSVAEAGHPDRSVDHVCHSPTFASDLCTGAPVCS